MSNTQKQFAALRANTRPWDPAEYLEDPTDIAAYLEAAFEDGDPRVITAALGDVARSKGMTAIATKSGLGRESLYKALSSEGNPAFGTVLNVLDALGLRLIPQVSGQIQSVPDMDVDSGWESGFARPLDDIYILVGDSHSTGAIRASENQQ